MKCQIQQGNTRGCRVVRIDAGGGGVGWGVADVDESLHCNLRGEMSHTGRSRGRALRADG